MKRSILIVEDDHGIRNLLDDILTHEGYQIVHAENGQRALTLAAACHPDVILMDLMLPVLDGISASCLLKDNPQTSEIPIIAMSARPRMLLVEEGCRPDRMLAKPFDLRVLLDVVDGVFQQQKRNYASGRGSTVHHGAPYYSSNENGDADEDVPPRYVPGPGLGLS